MFVFVCGEVENDAIRLDGWDVCFVMVPFGVACFVHGLPQLRSPAGEHRAVKHWVGRGKVY